MSNSKDTIPTSLSVLNELMPQFKEVLQNLGCFRSQITLLQNQVKTLEKTTKRHVKQLEKEVNKRKRSNKKPSGFAQPAKISDKLCFFMERPNGTEMARTEVTKYIIMLSRYKAVTVPFPKKRELKAGPLSFRLPSNIE